MNDYGGYCGYFLRVDLTIGQITKEQLSDRYDEPTVRKLLGGANFGLKILYDESNPNVKPYDPDNRLIFATGPLTGTGALCSGSYAVVTKGALSNLATVTTSNGFWGAMLKFSGFDVVIVQGAAAGWKYLFIRDGVAELRDASHLLGKDTFETESVLKSELGAAVSVACIGPAGENLVRGAVIENDNGHFAATNGVGAVMGSKKLKAIVVSGKRKPFAKHPEKFKEWSKRLLDDSKNTPLYQKRDQYGQASGVEGGYKKGYLPIKNLTTHTIDPFLFQVEYLRESDKFERTRKPCFACPIKHIYWMKFKEGPYSGRTIEEPEYESYAGWGPNMGITDPDVSMIITDLCDRLGLDLKEYSFTVSMAMECFEKGILTKKDTDGLDLSWGNSESVIKLLNKIAKREGFGNVLAEGVMRASESIGGDAPKFAAYYKKGIAPHLHDPRADWTMLLSCAVSDTGSFVGQNAFVQSAEKAVDSVVKTGSFRQLFETLTICRMGSDNPILLDDLAGTLSSVTGWELNSSDLLAAGERLITLARAFNIRHGATPSDDCLSFRLAEAPTDGLHKGVSIAPHFNNMVKSYYRAKGWDEETSKPLPVTLQNVGLEELVKDLWP